MKHRMLTTKQILKIYELNKMGKSLYKISVIMGVSYGTVSKCLEKLNKALSSPTVKEYTRVSYRNAIIQIREMEPVVERKVTNGSIPTTPTASTTQPDRYELLAKLFESFQEGLGAFIESEVDSKVHFTAKELKRVREENEQLKQALEGAKIPNFVQNLRNRFS